MLKKDMIWFKEQSFDFQGSWKKFDYKFYEENTEYRKSSVKIQTRPWSVKKSNLYA